MDKAAQPQCLQVNDDVADSMRRLGFGEDDIAHARAERAGVNEGDAEPADFEVHEDCWENWQFFMRVQRQWVYVPVNAGMGVSSARVGMDWTGIRAVVLLSRIRPARWAQLVDDLLIIENAVLRADEERHNKG